MIWIYCAVGLIVTVALGLMLLKRRNALGNFNTLLCMAEQAMEKGDQEGYEMSMRNAQQEIEKIQDEMTRFRMESTLLQFEARRQFRVGDLSGADMTTRKCLELGKAKDPQDTTGMLSAMHVFLAEVAQEQGDVEGAIAMFREAARLTSDGGNGFAGLFYRQMLIDVLREANRYDEALHEVETAREIEKKFLEATQGVEGAKQVVSMMEPDRALVARDYETAKQLLLAKVSDGNLLSTSVLDPTRYFVNLAEAMAGLGELDGAKQTMGIAIKLSQAMLSEGHPRLKRMEAKLEALAVAQ